MSATRFIAPVLLVLAVTALSAQEPRRVIPTGRAGLASHLRPGDRHVVIEAPLSRPHRIGPPPGETRARYLTSVHEVAIAARVTNVKGVLSRRMETPANAPTYRWWFVEAAETAAETIVSEVTLQVLEVLKGAPRVNERDRLTFRDQIINETYGTATIQGVRVDYSIPWLKPLVSGRRYIVFGSFRDDGTLVRNEAYEEPASGLLLVRTFLDQDIRSNDEFEQLTFEQALNHLENEIRK